MNKNRQKYENIKSTGSRFNTAGGGWLIRDKFSVTYHTVIKNKQAYDTV